MAKRESSNTQIRYGIGVVSRLTGISRDALRVWERRYGAVTATRSDSRRRLYTQEDVRRLMLIKALVDGGNSISSVARLSTPQLEQRLEAEAANRTGLPRTIYQGPCRVAAYGPVVKGLLKTVDAPLQGLEVVAVGDRFEETTERLESLEVDVLMLEYTGLQPDHVAEVHRALDRSGARRAVVIYGFASREVLGEISKTGARITALRSPINMTELKLACLLDVKSSPEFPATTQPSEEDIPLRLFSDQELSDIALASVTVRCECPHHLVTLISNLTSFESYSESCENRNVQDAALHAYLHRVVAKSRVLVEEALAAVAKAEGLVPKTN